MVNIEKEQDQKWILNYNLVVEKTLINDYVKKEAISKSCSERASQRKGRMKFKYVNQHHKYDDHSYAHTVLRSVYKI